MCCTGSLHSLCWLRAAMVLARSEYMEPDAVPVSTALSGSIKVTVRVGRRTLPFVARRWMPVRRSPFSSRLRHFLAVVIEKPSGKEQKPLPVNDKSSRKNHFSPGKIGKSSRRNHFSLGINDKSLPVNEKPLGKNHFSLGKNHKPSRKNENSSRRNGQDLAKTPKKMGFLAKPAGLAGFWTAAVAIPALRGLSGGRGAT